MAARLICIFEMREREGAGGPAKCESFVSAAKICLQLRSGIGKYLQRHYMRLSVWLATSSSAVAGKECLYKLNSKNSKPKLLINICAGVTENFITGRPLPFELHGILFRQNKKHTQIAQRRTTLVNAAINLNKLRLICYLPDGILFKPEKSRGEQTKIHRQTMNKAHIICQKCFPTSTHTAHTVHMQCTQSHKQII